MQCTKWEWERLPISLLTTTWGDNWSWPLRNNHFFIAEKESHFLKYCSGGGILQLPFLKAHSLYPINVKTKFSKTKVHNNTLHVMYCEGSGRRQAGGRQVGRQAAGGDGLQCRLSLRDFAAFSFCRLPSFTVVHPSVHHRFTLFRRWRSLAADPRAGMQAGRPICCQSKTHYFRLQWRIGQVGTKAGTLF